MGKNLILLWYAAIIFFLCHFILKLCNIKVKHTVNCPKSVFGFSHFTNEGLGKYLLQGNDSSTRILLA